MQDLIRRAHAAIGRLVDLRAGELPVLCLAFVYFFLLLCAYYILRPIRDQMGIAGGVGNLQWLFTGTFLAMLCAVPAYGWLVRTYPRRRFIPFAYRFFIFNLLIFFAIFQFPAAEVHAARAFFVWISVFNLFVVSVFWSFMADIFTNAQGKRLFGAIAAGGTAGAMLGPSLTAALAGPMGPVNLLLVSAVLLEAALACARRLSQVQFVEHGTPGPHGESEKAIGGGILAGVSALARSPYLLAIGLYLFMYTWTSTFLYFQQAEIVAEAFTDPGARTRVFALIDLAVNMLTLGLQLFVTGRLMARAGVTAALVLLPAVTAIGFAVLAAGPVLAVLATFQSLRRASNYGIARPAREVLFTVVPREDKYKAKNVLDTVVYRGGDAATGWLYAGLAGLGLGLEGLATAAVPVALCWLGVAWYLGQRQAARGRRHAGEQA